MPTFAFIEYDGTDRKEINLGFLALNDDKATCGYVALDKIKKLPSDQDIIASLPKGYQMMTPSEVEVLRAYYEDAEDTEAFIAYDGVDFIIVPLVYRGGRENCPHFRVKRLTKEVLLHFFGGARAEMCPSTLIAVKRIEVHPTEDAANF